MPNVDLLVRAGRAPVLDPDAEVPPFVARLAVRGEAFAESHARLFFEDGALALEGDAADVFAFCARAIAHPAPAWEEDAIELGLGPFPLAAGLGTTEQNAAKALFMSVQWLEPQLVRGRAAAALAAELRGNVIVAYRGEPGLQRHIYFVDQVPPAHVSNRLFRLRLLCKLEIAVPAGGQDIVWFVPVVVPGVAVYRFDPPAPNGAAVYRSWQQIRSDMGRRITLVLGG